MAERDKQRVIRRNAIPLTVHGLVEYGLGVLFILAPFLFSFDTDPPTVLAALLGAAILVMAVLTDAPTGLSRTLPLASHIVLDFVISVFVIASPFVFGFSDDDPALAFFLVTGVGYLLMTAMTRYHKQD